MTTTVPAVATHTVPVDPDQLRLSRKVYDRWVTLLNAVALCELDKKVHAVTGIYYRPVFRVSPNELIDNALDALTCPPNMKPELIRASLLTLRSIIETALVTSESETL